MRQKQMDEPNRETLMRMARAYDTECAAHCGEPSPWDMHDDNAPSQEWIEERITAMRIALRTRSELLTGHGDQRPKRGGWAPGFYTNTCQSCGRSFVGDKWAWTCADCAYADDAPHTPEQTGGRMIDTESIDERYAQFERRGQPGRHPTLEFGSVALERFIHDMMGEINRLRALQSNRVPQQTGDALADSMLEYLSLALGADHEGEANEEAKAYNEGLRDAADYIRRHLTASGVPYVPEALKGLPEQWRRSAEAIKRNGWPSAEARHCQLYECSYELEHTLAAAPTDGREHD